MLRLLVLILIALLAAACQPLTPALATNAPTPAVTPLPAFSADAVSSTPLVEGVLATDWRNDENWLIVLDPATGARLSAAEPIRLGENYFSASAPDGHTLAIVAFEGMHTIVHLVDLITWTEIKFALDIPRKPYLNAVRYSPDGRTLIIVTPGAPNRLYLVDLASRTIAASAQLDLSVGAVKFTRDGLGLMIYGVPVKQYSEITIGDPRVLLLSAVDLSGQWHVDLIGVQDGIYPKNDTQDNLHAPGAAYAYTPGLAFAPDRDVLYIVPGNSNQLLTVDFAAQRLSEATIARRPGLVDRLLALTAGVAHAKIMDGTLKQAVISADGKTLYVVGMTNVFTKQSSGEYKLDQTPLDLQAINTADGRLLAHVPSRATSVSISPDGRALYSAGNYYLSSYTPFTAVLDPQTLEIRQTFDGVEIQPGRRLNGSPILLSIKYGVRDSDMELAVLDFTSFQIIGTWRVDHYMGWVRH